MLHCSWYARASLAAQSLSRSACVPNCRPLHDLWQLRHCIWSILRHLSASELLSLAAGRLPLHGDYNITIHLYQ